MFTSNLSKQTPYAMVGNHLYAMANTLHEFMVHLLEEYLFHYLPALSAIALTYISTFFCIPTQTYIHTCTENSIPFKTHVTSAGETAISIIASGIAVAVICASSTLIKIWDIRRIAQYHAN
jgi:hypothetical protein